MMKRTPLKRSTKPIARTAIKSRSKPRRGEPTAKEKATIRLSVYERSEGRCQLNLGDGCNRGVLPFDGSVFERWHLVHVHAKRRFGWTEEQGNRLLGGCYWCHIVQVHGKGVKIPDESPLP